MPREAEGEHLGGTLTVEMGIHIEDRDMDLELVELVAEHPGLEAEEGDLPVDLERVDEAFAHEVAAESHY